MAISMTDSEVDDGQSAPTGELSAFQRDLLRMVHALNDPSGRDIEVALDDQYIVRVHHGRLYSNLDDLVDRGLVEKGEQNKRTNWYGLTDQGEAFVDGMHDWWGSSTDDELLETIIEANDALETTMEMAQRHADAHDDMRPSTMRAFDSAKEAAETLLAVDPTREDPE